MTELIDTLRIAAIVDKWTLFLVGLMLGVWVGYVAGRK